MSSILELDISQMLLLRRALEACGVVTRERGRRAVA